MDQSPDISELERSSQADIASVHEESPTEELPVFYVVSLAKFTLLFVCTAGFYQLYWFYMHFRRWKLAYGGDGWPAVRAAFSIFFAHGLFRRIDDEGGSFNAGAYATSYVVLVLAARIIDRAIRRSDAPALLDLIGPALWILTLVPLYVAQRAANRACNDPRGDQNSRITLANWTWCGLGTLAWLGLAVRLLSHD